MQKKPLDASWAAPPQVLLPNRLRVPETRKRRAGSKARPGETMSPGVGEPPSSQPRPTHRRPKPIAVGINSLVDGRRAGAADVSPPPFGRGTAVLHRLAKDPRPKGGGETSGTPARPKVIPRSPRPEGDSPEASGGVYLRACS